MRVHRTHTPRFILALLAGLIGAVCPNARAADTVAIQFTLDRPIDAVAAPFVMAQAGGLFSAEGLAVNINAAANSQEAIARVATGASEIALVDINALIRHRDKEKPDAPHAKAVFVLFNQAGYSIIARKSRGIQTMADLAGKSLGVVEGDPAAKLWPAVAKHNGIKLATIKQSVISPAVREPMLSAGQVDAVTGSSFLSALNIRDRGVPADDLVLLRFADYGCEAYGYAIIVNPAFAAAKPEAVKGFVRAAIGGPQSHHQGARARHRAGGEPDGRRLARSGDGALARGPARQHPHAPRSAATGSAASILRGSRSRSTRSPRISSSTSGRRRRISSTTVFCPRSTAG